MPDTPTVFLSHTSDLSAYPSPYSYVTAAKEAIAEMGMVPIEMGDFIARDISPADYCRELVGRSQVYVAIVGQKYGSTVPETHPSVSYCELEFNEALSLGVPCILLLLADELPIPRSQIDVDGRQITQFRSRLKQSGKTIATFRAPPDLKAVLRDSLKHAAGVVPDGSLAIRSRVPRSRKPWMVPSLGYLTPRTKISADLLELLLSDAPSNIGVVASVEGAGGVGKTCLVAMVCGDPILRERYPGGLLWLTIGQDCTDQKAAALAITAVESLTGEVWATSDPLVAGARLGETLDAVGPCLLVLDDVWSSEQLMPFLIGGSASRRLITTRNSSVVPNHSPCVLVDAMEPDEAKATIESGVKGLEYGLVSELLKATGRWPVLLGLINGTIADASRAGSDPNTVAGWVLDRMKNEGPAALDFRNRNGRDKAFATIVQTSLDQLSPAMLERYMQLGIFPEDAEIPIRILTPYWGDGVTTVTPKEVESTITRFIALRLVQEHWDRSGVSIRLHDVVRSYLRRVIGTEPLVRLNRLFVERVANTDAASDRMLAGLPWWELARSQPYLWDHICWHLREAELWVPLSAVACDLRWVCAKTEVEGRVAGALGDLCMTRGDAANRLAEALERNEHLLTPVGSPGSVVAAFVMRLEDDSQGNEFVESLRGAMIYPHLAKRWPFPDSPLLAPALTAKYHRGRVWCCSFGATREHLVTGSDDGLARLWNLETKEVKVLGPHQGAVRSCAFSSDGGFVVTGSGDAVARVWNAGTGSLISELVGHTGGVTGCAISEDGRSVVTVSTDGTTRIWDVVLGESTILAASGGIIRGCAMTPEGSLLVTCGDDRTARLWQLPSGTLLKTLTGHTETVRACAISRDGTRIATASADRTAKVWDSSTGEILSECSGHLSGLNSVVISADGSLVVTVGADRTARAWDLLTGQETAVLSGHMSGVNDCDISLDGTLVATAGGDRTCRIWRRALWKQVDMLEGEPYGCNACHSVPGARLIVTADGDQKARVRTLENDLMAVLEGHVGWVNGCALSSDRERVATAGADGTVRVWRTADGTELVSFDGHAGWARSCAFVPRQPNLLISTGDDGTIRLWDLKTRSQVRAYRCHNDWVLGCTVSPDGTWFVSTSADQTAAIWSLESSLPARILTGHNAWVRGCSISANGSWIATSSGDATVKIWDSQSGSLIRTLTGHSDWVNGCSISSDGKWIASASRDRSLRIWGAEDGSCVASFLAGGALSDCCWIDEDTICAAGDAGVYVLRFIRGRLGPS